MQKKAFPKPNLMTIDLVWWTVGLVVAVLVIYFLDYIAKGIYPSQIDDMGYAMAQRLEVKLVFLAILNVIVPIIFDSIKIIYTDTTQNIDLKKNLHPYFSFSFQSENIGTPKPRALSIMLIAMEMTFIVAIVYNLINRYLEVLNASMDFLIGGPGIWLLMAYILLIVNCCLIFFLFLCTFLWGYSWVQWMSDKVFSRSAYSKYYRLGILFFAVVLRSVQALLLIITINSIINFSGRFYTLIGNMFKTSILLLLWTVICLIPFMRERIILKLRPNN